MSILKYTKGRKNNKKSQDLWASQINKWQVRHNWQVQSQNSLVRVRTQAENVYCTTSAKRLEMSIKQPLHKGPALAQGFNFSLFNFSSFRVYILQPTSKLILVQSQEKHLLAPGAAFNSSSKFSSILIPLQNPQHTPTPILSPSQLPFAYSHLCTTSE